MKKDTRGVVKDSQNQMGGDQSPTTSGESSEILFEHEILEIVRAAKMLTDITEEIRNRLQKVEDRLEEADLEDMVDRLEVVEDADADNRCWQVEQDLEDLETSLEARVEALEGKSHD